MFIPAGHVRPFYAICKILVTERSLPQGTLTCLSPEGLLDLLCPSVNLVTERNLSQGTVTWRPPQGACIRPVCLATARNTVARIRNMETPAGGMHTACVLQFISFSASVILTFLLKLPCVLCLFGNFLFITFCLVSIFPVIDQVFC